MFLKVAVSVNYILTKICWNNLDVSKLRLKRNAVPSIFPRNRRESLMETETALLEAENDPLCKSVKETAFREVENDPTCISVIKPETAFLEVENDLTCISVMETDEETAV